MGVVDEAIEHGISVSRISNQYVPCIHGELAGDEGGTATVAILQDLQEIVAGAGIERSEAPVIKDQQIDAAEGAQQTRMASVAACERQVVEQARTR